MLPLSSDGRPYSLPSNYSQSEDFSLNPTPNIRTNTVQLNITNQTTRYRLKYGERFRKMLEPRDQVLEHSFNFNWEVNCDELNTREQLDSNRSYADLMVNIQSFLVEAVSNVVSIAFEYLCQNKLEEKEAMEYASKNIMLNVHSIFRATLGSIKKNYIIKDFIDVDELKSKLAVKVDQILNSILSNLAHNYPQAPASGGTPRMREVINEVNRINNQENDLIYANNIKISQYLKIQTNDYGEENIVFREDGDYTQFIMKVINTAIEVTQLNQQDERERTVQEIFTQFNQNLIWTASSKKMKPMFKTLEKEDSQSEDQDEELQISAIRKNISGYFRRILATEEKEMREVNQAYQNYRKSKNMCFLPPPNDLQKQALKRKYQEEIAQAFGELIEQSDAGIQAMKKESKMAMGQKIPGFVKVFSRQDIANKNFKAKHSSILRILTKWAQNLEKIFERAQQLILQRFYMFKTVHNELTHINSRQTLVKQLRQEYKEVKKKFSGILKSSYQFIGQFLSEQTHSFASNVCRYTQTRAISSKINAVLTSLMLNYTNILIHHLLKAGRQIWTKNNTQNINLIVFRVSDLLRAKYQCTESTFINLLRTMYILDGDDSMCDKFKLVRIKNKLDDPANNIMVNYLFMGKVQCELQLSIQEPKGKQKNYYTFSHFVYELTRGNFGVLADCAIMISQLDPLVTSCRSSLYVESQGRSILAEEGRMRESRREEEVIMREIKESTFSCSMCQNLVINQKVGIFLPETTTRICNRCVMKSKDPERFLRNGYLKEAIGGGLREGWLARVQNYGQLRTMEGQKYVLALSDHGNLSFNFMVYIREQLKTFMVKVDSKMLKNMADSSFDFSKIDYVNLLRMIRKEKKSNRLLYILEDVGRASEELFALLELNKKLVMSRIGDIVDLFEEFRKEKRIIKRIKFKAEIIQSNYDRQAWGTLDKVNRVLVLKEARVAKEINDIKYRKYKHLDLSNLKVIECRGIGLKELPRWLRICSNLKIIIMNKNQIQTISKEELPASLTEMSFWGNKLYSISVGHLSNLAKLRLNRNQLKEIDLQGLGKLSFLDLRENSLRSIDVSSLSNLTDLNLDYNFIEQFMLQHHKNLKKLTMIKNNVTKLFMSNLPKLNHLDLSQNKLDQIDLINLPSLVYCNVSRNKIGKMNLDNFGKLLHLNVSFNLLEKLDVSSCGALVVLNVFGNLLEEVGLEGNQQLEVLVAADNPLGRMEYLPQSLRELEVDQEAIMAYDFSQLPNLQKLSLPNSRIERGQLINLGEKVNFNSQQTVPSINSQVFSSTVFKLLGEK